MRKGIILVLLGLQIICLGPVYALTINLNDIGGVANSPAAGGFQKAATFWESLLTDNVTVNLDVGFNSLASGVLAQTGSALLGTSYTNVRNAMVADVTSNETFAKPSFKNRVLTVGVIFSVIYEF